MDKQIDGYSLLSAKLVDFKPYVDNYAIVKEEIEVSPIMMQDGNIILALEVGTAKKGYVRLMVDIVSFNIIKKHIRRYYALVIFPPVANPSAPRFTIAAIRHSRIAISIKQPFPHCISIFTFKINLSWKKFVIHKKNRDFSRHSIAN